jgi:hypothetical protein
MITLRQALDDPNIFGKFFKNPSWDPWKTFLAALFAEKPRGGELTVYQGLTGRTAWPSAPFTEAALIVGRRGGKSRILALIATYLGCFKDYVHLLAPGQRVRIAVLAKDREQAGEIFNYIVGLIEEVPLLAPMIARYDSEEIALTNRVTIAVATASFRSVRGYTLAAALCDELAFWRSDEVSANPDIEILRALRPGLLNIPGSMLLIASSPYAKKGELYNTYRKYFGEDDSEALVWKGSTLDMNPAADRAFIDREYARDPESAAAEYGGEFRSDLIGYLTLEQVEDVVVLGRTELPPAPDVSYSAFCDPSGGARDSMALAIGHLNNRGIGVQDAILEVRAVFDPQDAMTQCAALLKRYCVSKVIGDYFGGEWVGAWFARMGIAYEGSARPKSDLYLDFLPLVTSRRIELLDNPRQTAQLIGLERRTARGGRDSIDHMRGAHDDLANACAGLMVGIELDRRPPMVDIKSLTGDDGEGAADPRYCEYVYMVIVDSGADIAVTFCGSSRNDVVVYLLDVDVVYFKPGLFDELKERLCELGWKWRAAAAVFVPERLEAAVEGLGLHLQTLPADFKPELQLAFVAERIAKGLVRFCAPVIARMATSPIGAALTLKAGDAVETALHSALISSVWLKYARP